MNGHSENSLLPRLERVLPCGCREYRDDFRGLTLYETCPIHMIAVERWGSKSRSAIATVIVIGLVLVGICGQLYLPPQIFDLVLIGSAAFAVIGLVLLLTHHTAPESQANRQNRQLSAFGKVVLPLARLGAYACRRYDVSIKSANIAYHVGHELTLREKDGKIELICLSDSAEGSDPVKAVFVPKKGK